MSDRPRMWIGGVEIPVKTLSFEKTTNALALSIKRMGDAASDVADTISAFAKVPQLRINSRASISPAMQKLVDVYRFCRADPHWVSMWWYSPERDIVRQRRHDKRWQSSRRFREYVFKWALEADKGVTGG